MWVFCRGPRRRGRRPGMAAQEPIPTARAQSLHVRPDRHHARLRHVHRLPHVRLPAARQDGVMTDPPRRGGAQRGAAWAPAPPAAPRAPRSDGLDLSHLWRAEGTDGTGGGGGLAWAPRACRRGLRLGPASTAPCIPAVAAGALHLFPRGGGSNSPRRPRATPSESFRPAPGPERR